MAYVAQQAWIINASVKENVSFGKEWDEAKWNATVEVRLTFWTEACLCWGRLAAGHPRRMMGMEWR